MPSLVVAVVVGLAVTQVSIVLTTVYLHRTLAHRAMTLSPLATWICRVLLWITTGIRPRQWVAVHRKHHAYTDVQGDPHSPVLLGYWRVQLGNVVLYKRVARDPDAIARYARDLPPDRWDRLLFDHAVIGLSIGIGVLVALLGWQTGLVAAGVHVVTYLSLNAAINAVGHAFGSQPYDNTARNSQWLALVTGGEGLHNNHHAAPTSAKLALAGGEVDPGWWFVRLLRRCGQAQIRHEGLKLKPAVPTKEHSAA